jgi:hypothetical protein
MIRFQERFVDAIMRGAKRQTIRKLRKSPIRPGDNLILSTWTGQPYRSKVKRLLETACVSVDNIVIGLGNFGDEIEVEGKKIETIQRAALARADGFSNTTEMLGWFKVFHGLPFHGVIISW